MARGQLSGFIANPKSETASKTELKEFVDIVEKSAINANTAYGKVNNEQEADAVIAALRRLPQTNYTQEKILDYENKKLELGSKIEELQADNDLFDSNLRTALKQTAQGNYTDIQNSLIPSYATIYTDAVVAYEDLMAKRLSRPGSAGEVTQAQTQYLDELRKKADFYNGMANAYVWPDEDGSFGNSVADGSVAVLVDTNPATGKINNIEVVPTSDIPQGYMPSDIKTRVSPNQKSAPLPMFLRSFKTTDEESGKIVYTSRLGDKVFKSDASTNKDEGTQTGILKFQAEAEEGRNWFQKLTRQGSAGDVAEEAKKNGILFDGNSVAFDGYDIPENVIVRVGSKTYVQQSQGTLFEIPGKTAEEKTRNIQRLVSGSGVSVADLKTYYAPRDFVYNADGTSKVKAVADEKYFQVTATNLPQTTGSTNMFTPVPQTQVPFAPQQQPTSTPAFFGANKNEPVGLQGAREGNRTAKSTPDVIESGKGFFRQAAGAIGRFFGQ